MKEILTQYAAFNMWANKIMVDYIQVLSPGQQQATASGSFPSLYKTLHHLYEVEVIWWKRLHLAENVPVPGTFEMLPMEKLAKELISQSEQLKDWVGACRPEKIDHVIAYRNSKKAEFKQPVYQILLHLFNHQTYHRGQLVSIMHQLNLSPIPNTDFIIFSRK